MASLSGTFTAVQQSTTPLLFLRATETVRTTLTITGSARISLCRSFGPGQAVVPIETYAASGTYDWVNTTGDDYHLLLLCVSVTGSAAYTFADVAGDQILQEWRAADGTLAARITDQGLVFGMTNVVDLRAQGAVGDGVVDDTAAIQAAIDAASALVAPHFVLPAGRYRTTDTLTFDMPDGATVTWHGVVVSSVSGEPAVRIGSTSGNRFRYHVQGVKVERSTVDMTAGGATTDSVGVEIRNVAFATIDVRSCSGFTDGVLLNGTQSNGGTSYNAVHIGYVHDNKINLRLTASGSGFTNENTIYGGSYNHSSSYPNYTGTVNYQIDHYAGNVLNNNRIIAPSFEDNDTDCTAAIINGFNNVIFWPRKENPSDEAAYPFVFTANATRCAIIGAGFDLAVSNIDDSGVANSWDAKDGSRIARTTAADDGASVLSLMSNATSAAWLLRGLDTSGVPQWFIDGQGIAEFNTRVYAESGLRWSTSSGTRNDRGLFVVASGSPEGVVTAQPGSLCVVSAGGAGATLYVKESGSGNTGWVAK